MNSAGVQGIPIRRDPKEVEEERIAWSRAHRQGPTAGRAGLGPVPGRRRCRQPCRLSAVRAVANDRRHRRRPLHTRFGIRGWLHRPAIPQPGLQVPPWRPRSRWTGGSLQGHILRPTCADPSDATRELRTHEAAALCDAVRRRGGVAAAPPRSRCHRASPPRTGMPATESAAGR